MPVAVQVLPEAYGRYFPIAALDNPHIHTANSPCNAFRENELILFSRVNTMLQATSNILRLEGMQAKKDLESQVRDILDEIGRDASRRQQVMSTPQVSPAMV